MKQAKELKIISSDWLAETNEDLYSFLGVTDILITDYSSVYFDYLLLDRPIIFINNDLEEYRRKRGLLLEPYDFWTPGYKVKNQEELMNAINIYVSDSEKHKNRRNQIKDIMHEVENRSCERIWETILKPIIDSNQ